MVATTRNVAFKMRRYRSGLLFFPESLSRSSRNTPERERAAAQRTRRRADTEEKKKSDRERRNRERKSEKRNGREISRETEGAGKNEFGVPTAKREKERKRMNKQDSREQDRAGL